MNLFTLLHSDFEFCSFETLVMVYIHFSMSYLCFSSKFFFGGGGGWSIVGLRTCL